MKYLFCICTTIGLLFISCEEKEITISIPMAGITLSQPTDGDTIDLNAETTERYTFGWDEIHENGNTLVLSDNEHLLDPVYIDAGRQGSIELTADQLDRHFSAFGIEAGQSGMLYWSVKPTDRLSVAADEIRALHAVRIATRLFEPLDQAYVALEGTKPDTTLQFSWNIDGIAEADLALHFALTADFSGKTASIDVGYASGAYISHTQLQHALDELGAKPFTQSRVYWNVLNKSRGELLSRSSAVLQLGGMMVFTDTRGEETIQYRVTRVAYPDGTSQVWLAENLRTTRYPDGEPIAESDVHFAPASLGDDYVKAYGAYYSENVKQRIAPVGWRLPAIADFEKLFYEASLVGGRWGVLKDPVYYENFDRSLGNINGWGLGLVSAGQWSGGAVVNHKNIYTYLHASDCEAWKCVLHDGGATLWYPWTDASTARFIYIENQ